jgi:hypothetical protein
MLSWAVELELDRDPPPPLLDGRRATAVVLRACFAPPRVFAALLVGFLAITFSRCIWLRNVQLTEP